MLASVAGAADTMTTTTSAQTMPATAPADDRVILFVGEEPITAGQLDAMLPAGVPAEARGQLRKKAMELAVHAILAKAYVAEIPFPQQDVDAWKVQMTSVLAAQGKTLEGFMAERGWTDEDVGQQLKLEKMEKDATSKEKIDEYIKNSPVSYFDGTKVKASHILISYDVFAPNEIKDAYRQKLQGIIDEINAGKIDFAEAAKKHSKCPSGANGGDLGEFEFDKMVPPFAEAAFNTKVGEMTGIVETQFGLHVIKVTGRTEGSGEAGLDAAAVVKNVLSRKLEEQIFAEMLKKHPIRQPKQ